MPSRNVAVIAGATGLVGGYLTRILIEDAYFDRVVVLTRRELPYDHSKLDVRPADLSAPVEVSTATRNLAVATPWHPRLSDSPHRLRGPCVAMVGARMRGGVMSDLTTKVLIEIRDQIQGTNQRLDQTNARLDHNQPGLMNPTNLICSKCHVMSYNPGPGYNDPHSQAGLWAGVHDGYCTTCHVGIPHGWKRPRMLVYASDPAPYMSKTGTINNGTHILRAVELENHSPQGWSQYDCQGCSSGQFPHGEAFVNGVWP